MKHTFTFITLMLLSVMIVNSQNIYPLFENSRKPLDFDTEQLHLPFEDIRQVDINTLILEENTRYFQKGDKITFDLFDKMNVSATIDRVNQNINGTLSIRARLDDYPMGYIILSATDGQVTASIRIPELNHRYSLKSHKPSGSTFLKKLDVGEMDILESGPDMIPEFLPEMTPVQIQRMEKAAQRDDDEVAVVGVMVIYTPAAANWAATNENSVENSIAQSMEMAQLALDNSNTLIEMVLVHAAEVDYVESESSSNDLYALTEGSGVFAEVHEWREMYGADLVGFFTLVTDTGGLGWLLNNKSGAPGTGFSITRIQQASWTYTHIHEMGHNMGAHHHKLQNVQPGPTIWSNWPENIWSAGWRWQGDNNQMYVNVMSYSSGEYYADGLDATEVPYFSNPDISFQGVAAGDPNDADNARTLREIRHVIAAYTETDTSGIPLCVALDNCDYEVTTEGDALWTGQDETSFDGVHAAQSGPIAHNQYSAMKVSIAGPGQLSFRWKVSSEENYDFLKLFVNGTEVDSISGLSDWELKTVVLEQAVNQIRWEYTKNDSESAGMDCGWVDQLVFLPDLGLPQVVFEVKDNAQQPIYNARISITPQNRFTEFERNPALVSGSDSEVHAKKAGSTLEAKPTTASKSKNTLDKQSGNGLWIHWDMDENVTAVGLNDGGVFYTASRWTPADLVPYQGYAISSIRMYINNQPTSITLKIWQGPDENNLTEMYSQVLPNPQADNWQQTELAVPFPIDATQELWFGYEVDDPGADVFSAGLDDTEEHDGKGNKILLSEAEGWANLSSFDMIGNWNLQAMLEVSEPLVLFTNEEGMAIFDAIPGSYNYQVEKPGYEIYSGTFSAQDEDIPEHVTLNEGGDAPLVTFNVNVEGASPGFVPGESNVFLTGSFTNWAVPGSDYSIELSYAGNDWYTVTLPMEEGEHEYKYFSDAFGEGWDGGEWQGEPNRLVNVTGDMELNDTWVGPYHELYLQANPPEAGNLTGGGFYYPNTMVTIGAEINPGFVFLEWTSDENEVLSTEPVFNYQTVGYGQILTAHFEEDTHTYHLTTEVSPAASGSVSGEGAYLVGSQVELTASPAQGYEFLYWREDETIIGFDEGLNYTMPAESVHVTAYFGLMTSVSENKLPKIKVYPNPAHSRITITSATPLSFLEISDIQGRIIMKTETDDSSVLLDVSGWDKGLYFLRVYTSKGVMVQRFLVN